MKATIRFIIELEREVDIETTLKPGYYEFDDYEEEEQDELDRIQEEIIDQIDIPENEQCQYVKQSLNFTTLYVTTNP